MKRETSKFQLYEHPWLALLIELVAGISVLIVVIIIANMLGVPEEAPIRPLVTTCLAHILVMFIIVPIVLRLPNGKRSLREYLSDIRLANLKPFFPLLILGLTCSLLALLLLSTQSLVYRIIEGLPLTVDFLEGMIPIRLDLRPSRGYITSFPAVFEEVMWRGVMLVLFMRRYSAGKSVLITALGFSLLHLFNLLGDVPADFVLRQVVMGLGFGLFYGYLVLRTDSLLPAMLFHYLVNMFISSFTHYVQSQASSTARVALLLINIPLTTTGLILWTRFFTERCLPQVQVSSLSGWKLARSWSSVK